MLWQRHVVTIRAESFKISKFGITCTTVSGERLKIPKRNFVSLSTSEGVARLHYDRKVLCGGTNYLTPMGMQPDGFYKLRQNKTRTTLLVNTNMYRMIKD